MRIGKNSKQQVKEKEQTNRKTKEHEAHREPKLRAPEITGALFRQPRQKNAENIVPRAGRLSVRRSMRVNDGGNTKAQYKHQRPENSTRDPIRPEDARSSLCALGTMLDQIYVNSD